MRSHADAVIVGGGIIGLSVAFHLAREKYGRIIVLEKEQLLGTGATSKAAGGIRAQFSTKVNIEMSMLSEKLFRQFKEDTGSDALFDQVGYMFLLQTEAEVREFTKSYELQRSLGLPAVLLKTDEIPQYAPHIKLDGVRMATFCKDDGLGDPHEFLSGYEHAARRLGVEIAFESPVTGIQVESGRIRSVQTAAGRIDTPLVVNCAGPQSREVAAMAGAELPVDPIRRQIVTTGELSWVEPYFPMVVDVSSGLYFHKESKGMLFGWAKPGVKPSYDISVDPENTDEIIERTMIRIKDELLDEIAVANQWGGLYETTPDHHAVIGREPRVDGLFYCAGFSGHGFMHAPAAGVVTAEILTGKRPSIDIAPLAIERFAAGVAVEETNVI